MYILHWYYSSNPEDTGSWLCRKLGYVRALASEVPPGEVHLMHGSSSERLVLKNGCAAISPIHVITPTEQDHQALVDGLQLTSCASAEEYIIPGGVHLHVRREFRKPE